MKNKKIIWLLTPSSGYSSIVFHFHWEIFVWRGLTQPVRFSFIIEHATKKRNDFCANGIWLQHKQRVAVTLFSKLDPWTKN